MKKRLDADREMIDNPDQGVIKLISKLAKIEAAVAHNSNSGQKYFEWKSFKIYQTEDILYIEKKKGKKERAIKVNLKEKTVKIYTEINKEMLILLIGLDSVVYSSK